MNTTKLVSMVAVAGSILTGAAFAADTSSTITIRQNVTPIGMTPQVGIVKATATASATSAGIFTYDVLLPTSRVLNGCVNEVRDAAGNPKPIGVAVSATTINVGVATVTVSNSSMVSGTITTGDVATSLCTFY